MPSLQKEIVVKTLVTLAACMFGFAGLSHAAQITSPAIYAGLSQNVANCAVYNGGSTTQTVQLQIFDEAGTVLAIGNCAGPIPVGQFCNIVKIGISNDKAYACTATVTGGNITRVRGSIILQGLGGKPSLRSAALR
jgi:hypothetical protein